MINLVETLARRPCSISTDTVPQQSPPPPIVNRILPPALFLLDRHLLGITTTVIFSFDPNVAPPFANLVVIVQPVIVGRTRKRLSLLSTRLLFALHARR